MKKFLILIAFASLFSFSAFAKDCTANLTAGDSIKFDKASVSLSKSCKEITVNLAHTGKAPKTAMGHNLVLVKTADVTPVGASAAAAGVAKDYVPASDKVIAHSKLVGGGEKTSMKFKPSALKDGEKYTIICTFPGHWAVMKVAVNMK